MLAQILASSDPDSERPSVAAFVDEYFGSWSRQDLEGYGRCFHPNARIWLGDGNAMNLAPFLESQRLAHANSSQPMTEYPLDWDYAVRGRLATVWVHWQLEKGTERQRGYDFFTLIRVDGKWRIMSLVFIGE
jgi:hypothetical protein